MQAAVDVSRDAKSAQIESFGAAIDAIRSEIEAKVGPEDLAYIKRVDRFSRAMEVVGRVLIHFSFTPVGFFAGVVALWLHKQLQATEVGHTALHGAFDKIEGAGRRYRSASFRWDTPIDEESWRYVHNVRHHQYTNVAGKDPDIHFGPIRLNEHTPHQGYHRWQSLAAKLLAANFGFGINLQYTGVSDYWLGNGRPEEFDFIKERTPQTRRRALGKAMRKFLPYYGKNYVLFPALAGPFFWKVLLGNWLAEVMRDLYSAATIYVGHVGEHVRDYPAGTKAHSRAQWYKMQVEATNNFEVPLPISILCGALDRQIEHHLFPRLPTNRLREIAPKVRAACEEHGVAYHSDTWPNALKKALAQIARLSRPQPGEPAQQA
jgi:NADPH-dependent stearoyl-CoA 9-desaturase